MVGHGECGLHPCTSMSVSMAPLMCARSHKCVNAERESARRREGVHRGCGGVRGVMACYRGCIKAVYVREEV